MVFYFGKMEGGGGVSEMGGLNASMNYGLPVTPDCFLVVSFNGITFQNFHLNYQYVKQVSKLYF